MRPLTPNDICTCEYTSYPHFRHIPKRAQTLLPKINRYEDNRHFAQIFLHNKAASAHANTHPSAKCPADLFLSVGLRLASSLCGRRRRSGRPPKLKSIWQNFVSPPACDWRARLVIDERRSERQTKSKSIRQNFLWSHARDQRARLVRGEMRSGLLANLNLSGSIASARLLATGELG